MNLSEMNSMQDHQTPKPDNCGIKIKIMDNSDDQKAVNIKKCKNIKGSKIKLEYSGVAGVTGYIIRNRSKF